MRANRLAPVAALVLLGLLTACSAPTAGEVATSAVVTTPTPTPTPAAPSAPTLRVATTCDALVPPATAQAAAGATLLARDVTVDSPNPVQYADQRAGALLCEYRADSPAETAWRAPDVFVGVLPTLGHNEGFGSIAGEAGVPVDGQSYFGCPGSPAPVCFFGAVVGDYQVLGSVRVADGTAADAATSRQVFDQAKAVVAGLGSPGPLWQPAGGSLRGATSPDGLLPLDKVAAALGVAAVHPVRSEGGEYSVSPLRSSALSGAYWATFAADDGTDRGAFVTMAVLPGGASFYDRVKASPYAGTSDKEAVRALGDDAYLSTFRTALPSSSSDPVQHLDVKVKNSWLELAGASPEVLEQLAAQVIANLS